MGGVVLRRLHELSITNVTVPGGPMEIFETEMLSMSLMGAPARA